MIVKYHSCIQIVPTQNVYSHYFPRTVIVINVTPLINDTLLNSTYCTVKSNQNRLIDRSDLFPYKNSSPILKYVKPYFYKTFVPYIVCEIPIFSSYKSVVYSSLYRLICCHSKTLEAHSVCSNMSRIE